MVNEPMVLIPVVEKMNNLFELSRQLLSDPNSAFRPQRVGWKKSKWDRLHTCKCGVIKSFHFQRKINCRNCYNVTRAYNIIVQHYKVKLVSSHHVITVYEGREEIHRRRSRLFRSNIISNCFIERLHFK